MVTHEYQDAAGVTDNGIVLRITLTHSFVRSSTPAVSARPLEAGRGEARPALNSTCQIGFIWE
jgi:hypothetical protein